MKAVSGFFLCLLLLLSGCASQALAPLLRVGTAANMPPLVYQADGTVAGLEAALAQQLQRRLGRRIQWHDMPFEQLLEAVENGEVDMIMAGLSVTPARSNRVAFTHPYMQGGLMGVMRQSDLGALNSLGAVHQVGRQVGVEKGTTAEAYVRTHLPGATIVTRASSDELVAALLGKQVDYLVMDAAAVWQVTNSSEHRELIGFYKYLTHEAIAWAVQRHDSQLLEQLNTALDDMEKDGTLNQLLRQYIPTRVVLE